MNGFPKITLRLFKHKDYDVTYYLLQVCSEKSTLSYWLLLLIVYDKSSMFC